MKLFAREHFPLFLFTILQLVLVLSVFWYDGYAHSLTILYALFLGLLVFAVYLFYRFVTYRNFYRRLSRPLDSMTESVQEGRSAPLPSALSELLETQYRLYHNQLQAWERKNKEHQSFMNKWVHQMKTPLSVIELMAQDQDDERLASIAEEADRMRRGLETVLYAARLDTFEQDFSVEPVSLRQMAIEAVNEHKRYFIRSHVYPEVTIDPELCVQTDAKWMRFILEQLLTNSIKYSAGSGQKVTVSAWTEDGRTILEVRDRGVGIPREDLQRVFRPFYTGENGRRFKESTGMGLYLVKEAADMLNHQIDLESEVGQGTSVRILFLYGSVKT